MSALTVVEDLQILEDRIREFDACLPTLAIEELNLHSAPERLDHGVVVAISDGTHRWNQARVDGSMTYIEEMNATIEIPMELRRFPFDRERFEIVFEVLGFNNDEVLLEPDPQTTGSEQHGVSISEWTLEGVSGSTREYDPVYGDGKQGSLSAYVVNLDMVRRPDVHPKCGPLIMSESLFRVRTPILVH